MSSVQRHPRGKRNALHDAAECCSENLVAAILSSGLVDVDQRDREGCTPLLLAAISGGSRAVKTLLEHGASVAIAAPGGYTPLHVCAQEGHLAIAKMLVMAGASLEAATSDGSTPLHMAAGEDHSKLIAYLIEDGANVNSRLHNGATPLLKAAFFGHLEAVRALLNAKANPMLTRMDTPEHTCVALDVAAQNGHTAVVGEMVQRLGIAGCGGLSGGVDALHMAAGFGHVDVMTILTNAGVVDTGAALVVAAESGEEAAVRFLLRLQEGKPASFRLSYVNTSCGPQGQTPLVACIEFVNGSSQRVARRLVDAGADVTSPVLIVNKQRRIGYRTTPLATLSSRIREKKTGTGEDAIEEQLLQLEGIRRLLLRVDAVRAVSWLWPRDGTSTRVVLAAGSTSGTKTTPTVVKTPLELMLPALRRRNERRGVFLAALFRYSEHP